MRKMVGSGVARAMRISALLSAALVVASCSAEVTRLSQPFFSDGEPDDLTGSLAPLGTSHQAQAAPTVSAAPRTPITSPSYSPPYEPSARSSAISASPVAPVNIPRTTGNGFAVVQAEHGDTAYSLSRRYGIPAQSIIAANNMRDAQDLVPGQDVRIPPVNWRPAVASRSNPGASAPVAALQPTPGQPTPGQTERTHAVAAGETLYGIARRYDVKTSELARANGLQSLDRIRVGQRLTIPGGTPVRVASAAQFATDASPARAPVPAIRPLSAAHESAGAPEPRRVRTKSIQVAAVKPVAIPGSGPAPENVAKPASYTPETTPTPGGSKTLPEPEAMSAGTFRWPVRGRIISEFGSRPNGAQNDGINVAVPEGTSVKAAENGVVAYVGNELKGYGNLILVRHADDWVTAYAHNSQILVKRGDQVQRGQIIAKAGQTGAVTQPQLHFELRKGSRPVDPTRYMSGS